MNDETYLVFDATNMIHRTFFARENARVKQDKRNKATASGLENDADEMASKDMQMAALAHYAALATLNKYYNIYNPNKVFLAFDRSNWRKEYTRSEECISGALYKGNRRQNMTDKEQETFERFCEHINAFEDLIREHTGITVLAGDLLEADDLIAGMAHKFADTKNVIIVSADKDMMQLLKYPTVTLIDPASGQPRSLVEYDMDADYFIFQKCIRGDSGDNVKSAFPRVRSTRIKLAYEDPYEYDKLMKEEWINENEQVMVVGDLFKENKILMDLSAQPDYIQERIENTIQDAIENTGKFNNFKFVKFCGKYGLKKVAESLHLYQRMLINKGQL